jgi:ribosome biogenesis GTPase A
MQRAQRKLLEAARHADLVIEVRDARLPLGSANPDLERLGENRSIERLLLFNKADLADPSLNADWERHFAAQDLPTLFLEAQRPGNARRVLERARELARNAQQHYRRRGIRPPPPRVMVVGIPNVGKSTLINRLVHRKRLPAGPEPGVTREAVWVPIKGQFELMDTPGVLLPRLETDSQVMRLAWIGALPTHLIGAENLATALLEALPGLSEGPIETLYRVSPAGHRLGSDWLFAISRARHYTGRGGEPDLARAADQLLRDFREGRLGRITLESPPAL